MRDISIPLRKIKKSKNNEGTEAEQKQRIQHIIGQVKTIRGATRILPGYQAYLTCVKDGEVEGKYKDACAKHLSQYKSMKVYVDFIAPLHLLLTGITGLILLYGRSCGGDKGRIQLGLHSTLAINFAPDDDSLDSVQLGSHISRSSGLQGGWCV